MTKSAHLQHLAEIAEINSDVVVAVPGSFNRQQLSILLGLAQHNPFNVVGVVDTALAAALRAATARNILYADIQLHQVVISKLSVDDSHIHSGSTVQIPGVGSQNFTDLMMQLATGMFIQQCRFNPQHNAESEQQLYNELPTWLAQAGEGNLILELNAGDTVHTAKMPMDSLVNSLKGHLKKIGDQISAMATERDTQLIVSPALADLPGFRASLTAAHDLVILDSNAINAACIEYRELITAGDEGINLVKSLPVPERQIAQVQAITTAATEPTHLLRGNTALPVTRIKLENHESLNGHANLPGVLALSIADLPNDLGELVTR
ncbi:MAG: hypothetical protein MJA83_15295, partial [Gammaproteobacteria bacterium]|nr:hypothetical protein [Gammaproteobacteria bacterium]